MKDEEEEFWSKISYVQMSKNRRKVIKLLLEKDNPLTPSEISEELEIVVKSASRAVRQLSEKDIVECINPEAPRYRRYRLTKLGKEVAEKI